MKGTHQSSDLGFCRYAGHSGGVNLTWDDDTVIAVECIFGDYKTCGYADNCDLYQKRPVGFVQTYPAKDKSFQ